LPSLAPNFPEFGIHKIFKTILRNSLLIYRKQTNTNLAKNHIGFWYFLVPQSDGKTSAEDSVFKRSIYIACNLFIKLKHSMRKGKIFTL